MRRAAAAILAVTVGCVLADSAVVTLALPEILVRLHTTVGQVAWVLISFNLVLAIIARPAASFYKRRHPAVLCAIGIAVFAGASAMCAVAGSLEVLIIARSVQAVGGAFAVVGSLQLLVEELDERRGMAWWIAAGVFGTAVGPMAGGLLTDAFSWRSIFIVQVPIALLAVPAALSMRRRNGPELAADVPKNRVRIQPNIALALLSAALTAALFLFVLLLIDGWRRSPAVAAVTVSVIPLAALFARPLSRALRAGPVAQTMSGCLLIAAILTPVFTADLQSAQPPAKDAITALVLNAPLVPEDKIAVARGLADALKGDSGRVPDLDPAFAQLRLSAVEKPAATELERDLNEQLQRAATQAFRNSFLIGAALAFAALLFLIPVRRRGVR
jgi:MFS family permease